MDFLSKQIGVKIMEKFKIYIHHKYSYELFWYFFHGVEVDLDDVITHTNKKNAFNRKVEIDEQVEIPFKYKGSEFLASFVELTKFNLKGHHILDYSIYLLDKKLTSDRGFNSNIMSNVDEVIIPLLNKHSKNGDVKYHFVYIDWEGHNAIRKHKLDIALNKNINIYVDETPALYSYPNSFYPFTLNFMSFIYPNTLGLREFYFFEDILKHKKEYKHKINLPIRRFYEEKIYMFYKSLKYDNINVTLSSFHDTKQYSLDQVDGIRNYAIKQIGKENVIQKRGYGINDFGGEWNDDNINEMLWKLFDKAEVNLLPEYHFSNAVDDGELDYIKIGTHCMTEKSVSHILVGKPFIPFRVDTINFYNAILRENNITPKEYPLKYTKIKSEIEYLNDLAYNQEEWDLFVSKLQDWVSHTRNSIIKILNSKNDFLDILMTSDTKLTNTKKLL